MKNIIDKLANFVARNGPQFEEMTKQKQKDNPRFSFLFGGEFYTYYKFKVASEIARKIKFSLFHLSNLYMKRCIFIFESEIHFALFVMALFFTLTFRDAYRPLERPRRVWFFSGRKLGPNRCVVCGE